MLNYRITDAQDESDTRLTDWLGVLETIVNLHDSEAVEDELKRGISYERAEELLLGCDYLLDRR